MSKELKEDCLFTIIMILALSLIYFLSHRLIQNNIGSIPQNDSIYRVLSTISSISVTISPLFSFIFLGASSYIVLMLFDVNVKIAFLLSKLGYCYIPIIFSSTFSYFILVGLKDVDVSNITTVEDLNRISLNLGLTFSDIGMIQNVSYILFYIVLVYVLFKNFNLTIIKSIISATTPSVLIYLILLIIR